MIARANLMRVANDFWATTTTRLGSLWFGSARLVIVGAWKALCHLWQRVSWRRLLGSFGSLPEKQGNVTQAAAAVWLGWWEGGIVEG
ncbi:unnamed protein product [Gongylonema pulchrum]|uniref:Secreted protein n=1 Tax=Gongylonema pulchrum TaxID=637853 RepID=A0A183DUM4_9BILA|nr:unnamed protein product [Gongylonema pulchrum]